MSTSSVPAAGRSPFARFARLTKSKPNNEDDENEDNVIDEEYDEDEEDETGDDDETKKKKKAKKKAEDKEDEKDEDKPDARAARAREKARIRAIMSSSAGQQFPAVALGFACDTSMPRHAAIKTLTRMTKDLSASAGGDPLRDRMAALDQPDIGAGDARPAPNLAEQIILAGRKARGEI